jgi:sigma-E factor negative regulatory protein RseC
MGQKIEHEGVISWIKDGMIYVNIIQISACSGCHAKSMCSISEKKKKTIEISGLSDKYEVGEKVSVQGSSSMGLKAVFYSFVLPMILVVFILILSIHFLKSEVLAALLSVVMLVVYYSVLYLLKNRFRKTFVFTLVKH